MFLETISGMLEKGWKKENLQKPGKTLQHLNLTMKKLDKTDFQKMNCLKI